VRKNLVKELKKKTEDARVAARNVRRDANQLLKEAELSEDDEARALKQIQKLLDDAVADVERDADAKEKEIMEV
jgi:ribosome recycling factor